MPAPAVIGFLAAGPVALMVLTGLGARVRGMRWFPALLAGLAFPLTWVAWYVRDELPHGTSSG